MLLTITNTKPPATDLGFLLHKNPARIHTFSLPFGEATVFYPDAEEQRCTMVLMLDVNPVELVRGRPGAERGDNTLDDYVNDRPYVSSSFTTVALSRVFGTALAGRSKHREEMTDEALPLEASLPAVPIHGGNELLLRLFEPLGYSVEAAVLPVDDRFPDWGLSNLHSVNLKGHVSVHDLLSHLYVLLPVLDNNKHYYVGADEVEKLLRHGEGWLRAHPARTEIVQRYLQRRSLLTEAALQRLADEDAPSAEDEDSPSVEQAIERPLTLNTQRHIAVAKALRESGAKRILDLGCGEGRLLRLLMKDRSFTHITGIDVSHRALESASRKLRRDTMPAREQERLQLLHGSLVYRDKRLQGYDAAAVVEVVEHLDPPRLRAFENAIFDCARPSTIVLTTPNREYNVLFETLPADSVRHRDHRFEWSRAEFSEWASGVSTEFGYTVRHEPVGPADPQHGPPTQMAIFTRQGAA